MKKKLQPVVILAVMVLLFAAGCQMEAGTASTDASSARATAVSGSVVGWGSSITLATGTSVTVDTYAELVSALSSTSASIIYIDGSITLSGRITIQDRDKLSIIGKNNAKLVSTSTSASGSGIFYIKRVTNLLIQNVTFEGPGAYDTDGYDNLCIDNCQYVWVDHCDFQDGVDGNFDIKNMSDYVSVTWCKFQYKKTPIAGGSGGSDDHRYSNLIGSSDSATDDAGKLRVTYYYCHWAEGCVERMPRVRFGKVHVLNCLFNSSVSNNCIRAAYKSNVLVEGSYFDNQDIPIDLYTGYTAVKALNNTGVSDMTAGSTIFTPGYSYTAATASTIVSPITSGAGATLGSTTSTTTDSTCNLSVTVSGTSAVLSWSYSNFTPTSRVVYRDTDSDPSGRITIATVTGTSYTDSGLASGTYYYWIKSTDASGTVVDSNGDDAVIGSSSSTTTSQVCSFTSSGVSNSAFTVTGNYSNSKGTCVVGSTTYSYCLKMESATKVAFTTTASQTLTLVFGGTTSASGKTVKIDGTSYTTTASGSNYIVTKVLAAGTHTIIKGDSINLFYIKLE